MCPIKGMENNYAYLAGHCTALFQLCTGTTKELSLSRHVLFLLLPVLLSPLFYGSNCSFSSHHWLKKNFNTLLAQQELHMIR